ncbi:Conserved_hypothetical protein [Hexamita inflata]|uniref:Uncharacterized protein n=1 Tax=Hexamita inflata TaxID=28002 RepID=A0AA86UTV7_9EUKA|nr:Conserved hypothetical protein [Hexamita inflata]
MNPANKILEAAQTLGKGVYPFIFLVVSLINQELMKGEWFKKLIRKPDHALDMANFLLKKMLKLFGYFQGFIQCVHTMCSLRLLINHQMQRFSKVKTSTAIWRQLSSFSQLELCIRFPSITCYQSITSRSTRLLQRYSSHQLRFKPMSSLSSPLPCVSAGTLQQESGRSSQTLSRSCYQPLLPSFIILQCSRWIQQQRFSLRPRSCSRTSCSRVRSCFRFWALSITRMFWPSRPRFSSLEIFRPLFVEFSFQFRLVLLPSFSACFSPRTRTRLLIRPSSGTASSSLVQCFLPLLCQRTELVLRLLSSKQNTRIKSCNYSLPFRRARVGCTNHSC